MAAHLTPSERDAIAKAIIEHPHLTLKEIAMHQHRSVRIVWQIYRELFHEGRVAERKYGHSLPADPN